MEEGGGLEDGEYRKCGMQAIERDDGALPSNRTTYKSRPYTIDLTQFKECSTPFSPRAS